MTPEEKLQKELDEARAQIAWLKRREDLLRKQFAFYVQYGALPFDDSDKALPRIDV